MKPDDEALLAEKAAALERHLRRVESRLPATPDELAPETDATDAVILHLWQAVQIVIDVATAACVSRGLGTPTSYADAFLRLARGGHLDEELARRLVRAAGFRNRVAHEYDELDLGIVHEAARAGPADLRAFVVALRGRGGD